MEATARELLHAPQPLRDAGEVLDALDRCLEHDREPVPPDAPDAATFPGEAYLVKTASGMGLALCCCLGAVARPGAGTTTAELFRRAAYRLRARGCANAALLLRFGGGGPSSKLDTIVEAGHTPMPLGVLTKPDAALLGLAVQALEIFVCSSGASRRREPSPTVPSSVWRALCELETTQAQLLERLRRTGEALRALAGALHQTEEEAAQHGFRLAELRSGLPAEDGASACAPCRVDTEEAIGVFRAYRCRHGRYPLTSQLSVAQRKVIKSAGGARRVLGEVRKTEGDRAAAGPSGPT